MQNGSSGQFAGGTPWNKGKKNLKAAKAKQAIDLARRYGGSGTSIWAGILSDNDYNPDWQGTKRTKLVDQMLDTDCTVRSIELATTLPAVSATWHVEAIDPKYQKIAEDAEDMLFRRLVRPWSQIIWEIYSYRYYGNWAAEIMYKELGAGRVDITDFEGRHPNTFYRYQTEDGKPGITQILPQGGMPSIPIEMTNEFGVPIGLHKLLLFINEQKCEDYEGRSIVRPAWGAYYYKEKMYRIASLAAERQGVGYPWLNLGKDATDEELAAAFEQVQHMRANEGAGGAAKRDQDGNLVMPEFVDMKAGSIKDPQWLVDHLDQQIVAAVNAPFLKLGTQPQGSRALADSQINFFLMAEQAAANYVTQMFTKYALKPWCKWNYGVDDAIELTVKIGKKDVVESAQVISQLLSSGALTPSREIEERVREDNDLPKMETTVETKQNVEGETTSDLVEPTIQDIKQTQGEEVLDPSLVLNGAQVTAAKEIIMDVSSGILPRENALEMLSTFFNLPMDIAQKLLGKVGSTVVKKPSEKVLAGYLDRIDGLLKASVNS